jgi:hypothetical protein
VEPRHEHWIAAKHVLRYICRTLNYGVRYTASNDIQLHGFTDSDWAGSAEDREYFRDVFHLGLRYDILGQQETKVCRT